MKIKSASLRTAKGDGEKVRLRPQMPATPEVGVDHLGRSMSSAAWADSNGSTVDGGEQDCEPQNNLELE